MNNLEFIDTNVCSICSNLVPTNFLFMIKDCDKSYNVCNNIYCKGFHKILQNHFGYNISTKIVYYLE